MSELLKGSDHLTQAIAELKRNPFSPELITNYWRVKLQGESDIAVSDCNWTEKEIQKPMVDIRGNEVSAVMFYFPKPLAGKEGLIRLRKMYPEVGGYYFLQEGTPITDIHDVTGWIRGYATLDSVNRNTTQKNMKDFAKKQGYLGGRLGTYILASQMMKDLTGHYLNERKGQSRLLGSRNEGRGVSGVSAWFVSNGHVAVGGKLGQRDYSPQLGGWFEEVKKSLTYVSKPLS